MWVQKTQQHFRVSFLISKSRDSNPNSMPPAPAIRSAWSKSRTGSSPWVQSHRPIFRDEHPHCPHLFLTKPLSKSKPMVLNTSKYKKSLWNFGKEFPSTLQVVLKEIEIALQNFVTQIGKHPRVVSSVWGSLLRHGYVSWPKLTLSPAFRVPKWQICWSARCSATNPK